MEESRDGARQASEQKSRRHYPPWSTWQPSPTKGESGLTTNKCSICSKPGTYKSACLVAAIFKIQARSIAKEQTTPEDEWAVEGNNATDACAAHARATLPPLYSSMPLKNWSLKCKHCENSAELSTPWSSQLGSKHLNPLARQKLQLCLKE